MTSIFFNHTDTSGSILLKNCVRFAPHGQTYHLSNDDVDGFFWEYKTDYFSITILDFSLKQDINYSCNLAELSQFALFSSYIFNASGEIFTPPISNFLEIRALSFSIIINRFNSTYTNILTIIFLMYTSHKK